MLALVDMNACIQRGCELESWALKSALSLPSLSLIFPFLPPSLLSAFCSLTLHIAQNSRLDLSKLQLDIPFAFANSFLGIYAVNILTQVYKNKCIKISEEKSQK